MAYTRKHGEGYEICVSCGFTAKGKRKQLYRHWTPDKDMTPKQIEKELTRQAVLF
jgi:hypothetical protein